MITISNKFKFTVRAIALALVICICLSVVMAPKAYAISELVIVGAIALTLSAVAAVVILAAEPLGLKEPIMTAAQHGFQSPREFVADLLDRFGASEGLQRFVMLDKFQKGAFITIAGKVILDKAVSDFLSKFFSWAWSAEGANLSSFAGNAMTMFDPSNIVGGNVDLSGISAFETTSAVLCHNSQFGDFYVSAPYLFAYTVGTTTWLAAASIEAGQTGSYSGGRTGTFNISQSTVLGSANAVYVYSIGQFRSRYNETITGVSAISVANTVSSPDAKMAYVIAHSNPDIIGGSYDEDGLVLPAPSTSNVLDVPGALTLPAPIYGTTTATQYLEAAADAITAGSGSLEYEDANGYTQTGTLEGTGEIGLTQVGAQSAELEGAIEIADSVGSETLDNYTIDLKDFFPFCIPFDLWDMLNLLESAPAPVSVEWQFDFGQLGEYEMEINLEEWNSVAQTLRTMELLAFCFGLAMLTKRILMGS